MKQNFWSYLNPKDIVDIIAPASQCSPDKLENGIQWLKKINLIPRVPKNLLNNDLFFSAPLEQQLEDLKNAIYSDSKGIWCLRGGYGSMRLIPHLAKLKPPKKSKLFLGFSDITALHLFFTQHWNWPVLHARNISQMHPDLANTPDRKFLREVIFGKKDEKIFKSLKPLNNYAKSSQKISAHIVGGNLRIVQSSLGTPWEINTSEKILFFEDIGERGYSVDRMLEQLIQAKIINKKTKAVLFGSFTECNEKDGSNLVKDALIRFAQKVTIPVLMGVPAGHDEKVNYPIPFNTSTTLVLGKTGQLHCHYGGKR